MTERLLDAMMDPKRAIVVHHNHPNSRTLSEIDIAALAYPGVHSVWAHGHDGTVSRGALTVSARGVLASKTAADATSTLHQLAQDVGTAVRPIIQTALWQGKLNADQAARIHYHLLAMVLDRASVIDYRDNFDLVDLIQKLSLDRHIQRAAIAAKYLLYGNAKSIPDHRVGAPQHTAEVGTSLDRAEILLQHIQSN
jgi:hypothetical protein